MSTVKYTPPFFLYKADFYEAEKGKCKSQTVIKCEDFVYLYAELGGN